MKDQAAAVLSGAKRPSGPLRDDAANGLITIAKPETNSE
jgi:hypothetical protein